MNRFEARRINLKQARCALQRVGVACLVATSALAAGGEHVAQFRGGELVAGGPVVFRGRRFLAKGDHPSVGMWIPLEKGQGLVQVEVVVRAPAVGSRLQALVNREPVGPALVAPKGGPHTLRFPLDGMTGTDGLRVEVAAVSGRSMIEHLRVETGATKAPPRRLPVPARGFETRFLLPRRRGARVRFQSAARKTVELAVVGQTSTRHGPRIRVNRVGADSYSLFTLAPGLAWSAHRNPDEMPVSLEDAPIPLALGPWILPGDELFARGRRRSWTEVRTKGQGVVLRVRSEGPGPALDLEWEALPGRGPTRWAGQLFGETIDWRVEGGAPAPRAPLPPGDPDPAPDPAPGPGPGDEAEELAAWDTWLAREGLDPYGRKTGAVPGGTIRVHPSPDLRGQTRLQWLRGFFGGGGGPSRLD